jgi:MFS family permease
MRMEALGFGSARRRSGARSSTVSGVSASPETSATRRVAAALLRALAWLGLLARGQVVEWVGGPARARVITLFAAVLALSGADAATVGAVAPQLEHALHIGNAKVGLLSSVSLLVGAVFVIPVGLFVDRTRRMPLLAISIVLWSTASLVAAFAGSYWHLLLARLALGAVTATAGPAIASLTGDYFPARERTRIYSFILGGEAIGTAAGFMISGTVASLISWRAAFILLAIPGFFLARTLWRTVPEPARGGQSWLEPGELELAEPPPDAPPVAPVDMIGEDADAVDEVHDLVHAAAQEQGIEPDPEFVIPGNPAEMKLAAAMRYTVSVPTNLLLIISSSLGYFYFAGLQTFALLFVRGHYHVGQATSELGLAILVLGALLGTLVSGQLTDRLLRAGVLAARIWVPAVCYLAAAVVMIPGILGTHLFPALWFDAAGAALISAANPPLDAARLDIMPSALWGRAESARTFLRSLAQAIAPLLFGGLADVIAGIVPAQAPIGTHFGVVSPSAARGLEITFLLMLTSLAAAGVFLLRARHTYATDVATAAASGRPAQPAPAPAAS